MKSRLTPALNLREYYRPYSIIEGGLECISYPFPDEQGGVSILVRVKDDPTTMRQVAVPESDWK